MTEHEAIEQLTNYRRNAARIQVLSSYPIGSGMTVSRLNEDDQLQALHARLRQLPSYMYLSKHEQLLEATAGAYLTKYPAGTRAQLHEMHQHGGADAEDEALLAELRGKIRKVIKARGWDWPEDQFDEVLNRLSELHELQEEVGRIDRALEAMDKYKPNYAKLLRLRYIDGLQVDAVAEALDIVTRTFDRWRSKAIEEYIKMS